MRIIGWRAALAGVAGLTLGAGVAQAGGQVGLAVGAPVPYVFPPPSAIPAPIAPLPSAPGAPAPATTVAPLPPLVLYAAPPVVVPIIRPRSAK